jgi:integrase
MLIKASKLRNLKIQPRDIRSLSIEQWPRGDAEAWQEALRPGLRLKRGGRASHMKPVTQKDLQRRYGYLLDFCCHTGLLDLSAPASGHVTPEIISGFLGELQERVGSVTVYHTIYKIRRGAELINPDVDLSWLREIECDLDREKKARPKHHRIVDPTRIVAAGLQIMDEVLAKKHPSRQDALRYRDGLMIALCAMCPIRLKNITSLRIGDNLIDCGDYWLLVLTAEHTKEKRLDERQVPDLLTNYIDRWIKIKQDLLPPSGNAMWASRYGGAIGYSRVEKVITELTRKLFGRSVCPHLLRDAAVHFVAMNAGDQMGIASAVLNHTDPRTTEKHYNKGASVMAAQVYQDILLKCGE